MLPSMIQVMTVMAVPTLVIQSVLNTPLPWVKAIHWLSGEKLLGATLSERCNLMVSCVTYCCMPLISSLDQTLSNTRLLVLAN